MNRYSYYYDDWNFRAELCVEERKGNGIIDCLSEDWKGFGEAERKCKV